MIGKKQRWEAYLHNPYPEVELLASGGEAYVESAAYHYLLRNPDRIEDDAEVVFVRTNDPIDVHEVLLRGAPARGWWNAVRRYFGFTKYGEQPKPDDGPPNVEMFDL